MIYQIIIVVGLIIFMFNIILNLRNMKSPNGESHVPHPAPFISVLVPARNEEKNMISCLQSLQKQDYQNFEVIVLDDNSSDNTSGIINEVARSDKRFRLITGEPLPQGWAGKSFACVQLAMQARGTWLLFTDADTIHEPSMLRTVLALALDLKPSLLSGFPRQLTTTIPQKVIVPVFNFIIMSWLPLWWFQHLKRSKPSLANGQFLLFPREEYWRVGGHEAVKSKILEDVWLGSELYRKGGNLISVDLSPVVSCHMYQTIG